MYLPLLLKASASCLVATRSQLPLLLLLLNRLDCLLSALGAALLVLAALLSLVMLPCPAALIGHAMLRVRAPLRRRMHRSLRVVRASRPRRWGCGVSTLMQVVAAMVWLMVLTATMELLLPRPLMLPPLAPPRTGQPRALAVVGVDATVVELVAVLLQLALQAQVPLLCPLVLPQLLMLILTLRCSMQPLPPTRRLTIGPVCLLRVRPCHLHCVALTSERSYPVSTSCRVVLANGLTPSIGHSRRRGLQPSTSRGYACRLFLLQLTTLLVVTFFADCPAHVILQGRSMTVALVASRTFPSYSPLIAHLRLTLCPLAG